MSRLQPILACCTLLLTLASGPPLHAANEPDPLNVVFILIDDLGYGDLACYGNEVHQTPNIDRLASQGMRFTQAYSNGPNCAPTRASLMTGVYTPRHGIYTVNSSSRGKTENRKLMPITNTTTLADQFVTLPEHLSAAGYTTAIMGKWHLGDDPATQGFDINIGGTHMGHPPTYFSPYRNRNLPDGPEGEYLTDRLTDEAVRFLDEHRDQPFFLYLSHFAVHTPVQAKADLVARYGDRAQGASEAERRRRAEYAAMLHSVDEGVGRVMTALDQFGLADNTLVILFSDNGGHARFASNAPLRGSKGTMYEGGIRVPLIVRLPDQIKAGTTCHEPVISSDFLPTILDYCEVPVLDIAEQPMDGLSLRPILEQPDAGLARDAIFWHFPAYLAAYTPAQGTWRTTPAGAIRMGRYKLIEFFEDDRLELYDLQNDVGETKDLAAQQPAIAQKLLERLRQWRTHVEAPVPTEPNPAYQAGDG